MRVSYNISFYHTKSLRDFAKLYLEYLPTEVNTIVSTGSSGCSIAAAMLCLSNRPLKHVYISKVREYRHADKSQIKNQPIAIVDDFFCSGKTILRLLKTLTTEYKINKKIYILVTSGFIKPIDDIAMATIKDEILAYNCKILNINEVEENDSY